MKLQSGVEYVKSIETEKKGGGGCISYTREWSSFYTESHRLKVNHRKEERSRKMKEREQSSIISKEWTIYRKMVTKTGKIEWEVE